MIRKVLGTILTRMITALLTLAVVVMNARFLGAEKVGVISLVILAVTIVQMVNNFVGGASLVYLVPRTPLLKLFIPSYIWGVVSALLCTIILRMTGTLPAGFFVHILALSALQSLVNVNSMILLGQERIRAINVLTVIQFMLTTGTLGFLYFLTDYREVMGYLFAMYISFFLVFLCSFALITTRLKRTDLHGMRGIISEILRFGTWAHVANISQLFNYRLSYYLIEMMISKTALGIYATGVQVSEGVWLLPKSMAMVQYSRITNETRPDYGVRLTLMFAKIGILISALAVGILLLLPPGFFIFIFGTEFAEVKPVIASLAGGIVLLSFAIPLSAFFSGIGKPRQSAIAAGIGLVFTVGLSLLLIPSLGILGAGIATTCSYAAITLYQAIMFIIITRVRFRDFLLHTGDVRMLIREIFGDGVRNFLKTLFSPGSAR